MRNVDLRAADQNKPRTASFIGDGKLTDDKYFQMLVNGVSAPRAAEQNKPRAASFIGDGKLTDDEYFRMLANGVSAPRAAEQNKLGVACDDRALKRR